MTTKRVQRFSKKATRLERMAHSQQLREHHQKGEGLFRFRNRSKEATLTLPKISADGKRMIGPANPNVPGSGEFEGDSYFLSLVPRECVLVETIQPPQKKAPVQETTMTEEKLILDQPEQVTEQGTVEHVSVSDPNVKPLNEQPGADPATKPQETLLTEDPMDGVTIIRD